MKAPEPILVGFQTTRDVIRQGLLDWDATNLSQIEKIRSSLDNSIPLLEKAVKSMEASVCVPVNELTLAAEAIRNDSLAMARLVDAAAAFVRSVPIGYVECDPGYQASGEMQRELSAQTAKGYLG